ncbi:NUDIX domain-containing protein [Mesobacillus jeotgali]|uniref:NUDIX domain-containing protein n=1 Tax=Mesobacillus jeotgali TaxID=129985 RepID=UPI0009A5D885|nr:NUDIX domain-containing protein [Mesobacillus jeotgali]
MVRGKNNGFELIGINNVSEPELEDIHPLAGSFAIIEIEGSYLLGYNSLRNQWELPAGKREEDETPLECAKRELSEETGQIVEDLQLIGLARVKNLRSQYEKFNPLYFATIHSLMPFKRNEETTKIMLWNFSGNITIDQVDLAILQFIVKIRREHKAKDKI